MVPSHKKNWVDLTSDHASLICFMILHLQAVDAWGTVDVLINNAGGYCKFHLLPFIFLWMLFSNFKFGPPNFLPWFQELLEMVY